MAVNTASDLVDRYFTALTQKDWTTLRTTLRDDLSFRGPLATLDKAEAYVQGLQRIRERVTSMERRAVFAQGDDVLQIYDVTLAESAVTVPVAEWLQVRDDQIVAVEMFLDARPLAAPPAQ